MKKRPFLVFGLLSCLLINPVFAKDDENTNPTGCLRSAFYFKMKTVVLTPSATGPEQSMYFFHNLLNEPVTLSQMRGEESSRSLYLNHTIQPNQWAVLATGEKKVRFICSVPSKKSDYGQVVNCNESINVCAFTHVRFGLNNRGNYWIVDNNNRNGAVRDVVHYGIIP